LQAVSGLRADALVGGFRAIAANLRQMQINQIF
jgi:hypothetical protein